MATASVSTTLVNGTANSATPVNGNFTDLVTFLNGSVVHRDGTKAMTAALDMGTQKISNLLAGTASTDAVNKAQLDAVGGNSGHAPQTSGVAVSRDTLTDIPGLSVTFTATTGRLYKYTFGGILLASNAFTAPYRVSASLGGVAGHQFYYDDTLSTSCYVPSFTVFKTGISGSQTVKLQVFIDSPTGGAFTTTFLNSGADARIVVEDVGV